jgi:hypothetical protein
LFEGELAFPVSGITVVVIAILSSMLKPAGER